MTDSGVSNDNDQPENDRELEIVRAVGIFLATNGYASLAEAATKLGVGQQELWNRIMSEAGLPACEISINVAVHRGGEDASSRPQFSIVVYWTGQGFATASGTDIESSEETGLLYYGRVTRLKRETTGEADMAEVFRRIVDEELPAIIEGDAAPKGATYSGDPVEVFGTLDLDSSDMIVSYRVPFRALDS